MGRHRLSFPHPNSTQSSVRSRNQYAYKAMAMTSLSTDTIDSFLNLNLWHAQTFDRQLPLYGMAGDILFQWDDY